MYVSRSRSSLLLQPAKSDYGLNQKQNSHKTILHGMSDSSKIVFIDLADVLDTSDYTQDDRVQSTLLAALLATITLRS